MATLLKANEVTKIYAKGQRPSLNKVSTIIFLTACRQSPLKSSLKKWV